MAATRPKLKVAIVEDEDLYRDLLRVVLSQQPDLEVVGAFAEGQAALEAMPALDPQVAILDIELPGPFHGVELGFRLRAALPALAIVLLSNHAYPELLAALPPDAARGWSYLLKKSVGDTDALLRGIEGAAAGFVVLDPQITSALRPRPAGPLGGLTPRQREILGLIAQGFTNEGIAQRLVLQEKSVENQIHLIYEQLGIDREDPAVQPRVSAVLLYLQESRLLGPGAVPGKPGG